MESREDLEKRKREVEKLRKENQYLEDKLRTIEDEIDTRYPRGAVQDQRKHHALKDREARRTGGNGKSKGGKTPQHTTNE